MAEEVGTHSAAPVTGSTDKLESLAKSMGKVDIKGGEGEAATPSGGTGADCAGVAEEEHVTLTTGDKQVFVVDRRDAAQSLLIRRCIEDGFTAVPLPNVDGESLAMVIRYWVAHRDTADREEGGRVTDEETAALRAFDLAFVKELGKDRLLGMVTTASYLESMRLFDLLCRATSHHVRDMTVEEVREYFCVENDFTPQEEADVRNEYPWVFE